ncbi:hypothetical protein ACO0LL_28560 [Undibacterium sp. TC4M20W]|uniref:hypothetical protein n=1 Tax=Undibacterium sp. TC4M20W TaxID=3413052 RepID=UPI003BF45389
MAYLVGVDSFTYEKTYGYDSSTVNQVFKVQLGRNSFGKLSSFDTTIGMNLIWMDQAVLI